MLQSRCFSSQSRDRLRLIEIRRPPLQEIQAVSNLASMNSLNCVCTLLAIFSLLTYFDFQFY